MTRSLRTRRFDGGPLRAAREAAGLSQRELAARAGVAFRTVGYLERGEGSVPWRTTIDALADALGVAPEALVAWLPPEPPRGGPEDVG